LLPFGIDAYGVYLPLYFYDVYLIEHVHASLSMPELGNIGPAISYWGFNYPQFRSYSGVGFQYNRQWRKFQAKIETGFLFHYEHHFTSSAIGLPEGRTASYIRFHIGHKFGRFISTGFVFNWIPRNKNVTYIANYSGSPLPTRTVSSREDFFEAHESMVVFIGFSIR
ncbi:MAG: hypothetical protein AAGD28_22320, partial [Bacteroidota bacterium]